MPNFSFERYLSIVEDTDASRFVCIIGNSGEGKTIICDSLIARFGIIISNPNEGIGDSACDDDSDYEYHLMSHPSFFSMYYNDNFFSSEVDNYIEKTSLIHLFVDHHQDNTDCSKIEDEFDIRFTHPFIMYDGALCVVDSSKEIRPFFKILLRECLKKKVVPLLLLNKLDCLIIELAMTKEQVFQSLNSIIEECNSVLKKCQDEFDCSYLGEDFSFDPVVGNVIFCCGIQGWGFTIETFSKLYHKKFGINVRMMNGRLWNSYLNKSGIKDSKKKKDEKTKITWTNSPVNDEDSVRAFCKFILDPIFIMFKTVFENKERKLRKILKQLSIKLTFDEHQSQGKKLLNHVMRKFLPISSCIGEVIHDKLPSPRTAQKYRGDVIYGGIKQGPLYQSILKMDRKGPLFAFSHRFVKSALSPSRTRRGGRKYVNVKNMAVTRVFSGMIRVYPKQDFDFLKFAYKSKEEGNCVAYSGHLSSSNAVRNAVLLGRYYEICEDIFAGGIGGVVLKNNDLDSGDDDGVFLIEKNFHSVNNFFRHQQQLTFSDEDEMNRISDCLGLVEESIENISEKKYNIFVKIFFPLNEQGISVLKIFLLE